MEHWSSAVKARFCRKIGIVIVALNSIVALSSKSSNHERGVYLYHTLLVDS